MTELSHAQCSLIFLSTNFFSFHPPHSSGVLHGGLLKVQSITEFRTERKDTGK